MNQRREAGPRSADETPLPRLRGSGSGDTFEGVALPRLREVCRPMPRGEGLRRGENKRTAGSRKRRMNAGTNGAHAAKLCDTGIRRWFAAQGISCIERVMTDNGSAYVSRRFRKLLARLCIRHIRTRPYHPETNGKPNASSKLCCSAGRTSSPIRLRSIGLEHFRLGCTITMSADHIAPSE
jgi:Integrase core domain